MSKHTKGDWKVIDGRSEGYNRIFINSPSGVICRISNEVSGRPLTEEDVANAYILAAAPEFLKALESIIECCEECIASRDYSSRQAEIRGIARNAVAKIKGV